MKKVKKEPKKKVKKEKVKVPAKKETKGKGKGKAKKATSEDKDEKMKVIINVQQVRSTISPCLSAHELTPRNRWLQAVSLTFSIKYLSNFAKSTPLSESVHVISLSLRALAQIATD